MKTLIKKIIPTTILTLTIGTISFAGDTVPFFYNVLPEFDSNSIIDSKNDVISFDLWEDEEKVFVNGEEVQMLDNHFVIDTHGLSGKQEFVITNDKNEEVIYTYYISDEDGFVEDYEDEEIGNKDVYVTTYESVKFIYTEKDARSVEKVFDLLDNMPTQMKENLKEIKMVPSKTRGNVAGVTKYDSITFYGLSSYRSETFENIVYHEVAHTWAYELIRNKVLDFNYSEYSDLAREDDNYVSNYSRKAIIKNDDYSEDFAESVAFYMIDSEDFEISHPARAEFISSIID